MVNSTVPERPITGELRTALIRCTTRLSDALNDSCEDFIIRARLYSYDDEIHLKAIVSDEDGAMFQVLFQVNKYERQLRVSNRFKGISGRSRGAVLNAIKVALFEYIETLSDPRLMNDFGFAISSVYFDVGAQRYRIVSYSPDLEEKGSVELHILGYGRESYGMADVDL